MNKIWGAAVVVILAIGAPFVASGAGNPDRSDDTVDRNRWHPRLSSVVDRLPARGTVRERPERWRVQEALPAPDAEFDAAAEEVDVATAAAATPTGGADLNPTIDVQITQEIIDKANELGSVRAIYEFVRNEFEFQPYYGSQKGSIETLRQRSGNDYDLASLLIALLRASGTPARYGEGVVEMTPEQASAWLAVDGAEVAGSILFTRGMEGTSIVSSGGGSSCCVDNGTPGCDDPVVETCVCAIDAFCCNSSWDQTCADEVISFGCGTCESIVVAVRARRIWVEAFTSHGFGGDAWVPLDPAFKANAVRVGRDIPQLMGLDARDFIDEYFDPTLPGVTLPRLETPLELLEQDVIAYVDTNFPGLTLEDVKRRRAILPESLQILPSSLPYVVRTRDGSFSEIPASRRYQIRFHLYDGGTTLIDHTLNLPEIAGRRVTLSYEGATAPDQSLIDANNGLLYTPPNLINIRPLLKIAGQTAATGLASIGAGRTHNSDMYFLAPVNGSGMPQNVVPAIFNSMVAGELQAIGISVHGTSNPLFVPVDPADTEGFLPQQRYANAMDYLERGIASSEEIAALSETRFFDDVGDAIVKDEIVVTTDILGNPTAWEWRGLTVDADRLVTGAWKVDEFQTGCGGAAFDLLVIGGAEGSLNESILFEDDYGQEAVSTIKILQLAADQGITVYKRWNTLPLPANTLPTSTRNAIQSAIAGGHEVTFPADPITYFNWVGAGYIDMDPCTGAAGYIIAGGQNGGSTVDTWVDIIWANPFKTVKCVEGQVDSPAMDAPDSKSLFINDDTKPLVFVYQLRVEYTDGSFGGWTTRSHTSKAPKQLAPDNYVVTVGDKGAEHKRKLIVFEIKLQEVSYSNNHDIKKDDGSMTYSAPHWVDTNLDGTADAMAGEKNHPIAFTRNKKMSAEAKFKVKPTPVAGIVFKVRGQGKGSLDIPEKTATVSGDTIASPKTPADGAFDNDVQKGGPLNTDWEVSVDGGTRFVKVGTSDNQCYVTLGDPVATPIFHTLVHLGCENADGNTDKPSTVTDIWGEFTDRSVSRVDGTAMTYYNAWTCSTTTTAGLLSLTDGQCGSWAKLMLDMLKTQGIDQSGDYVVITPSAATGAVGFLVKDWTFAAGGGISGFPGFPYLNLPEAALITATSYDWKFEEVSDGTGIPGQSTSNPASLFNNHQFVKIGGMYYDPSYGASFGSIAEVDNASIEAYFLNGVLPVNEPDVGIDLNGDGDALDLAVSTSVFVIQQNGAGNDLQEMIYDY